MPDELIILDAVQGSEEWHAARRTARPSSMAPWITRASRHGTPKDAFDYFTGKAKEPSQWLMNMWAHGRGMEPYARSWLEDDLGVGGEQTVGIRGLYLASLDFHAPTQLGEIKCPHQGLRSKTWLMAERGVIDPGYVDQMEQQCRVFGIPDNGLYVFVDKNHRRWLPYRQCDVQWALLQAAWDEFFRCLKLGTVPAAPAKLKAKRSKKHGNP